MRVLCRRFRTLFLTGLERTFRQGHLRLGGALEPLADPAAFQRFLQSLRNSEWVVYSKPPFDGPARVLDYLGRYTHRVAISNDRILAIDDGAVRRLPQPIRGTDGPLAARLPRLRPRDDGDG